MFHSIPSCFSENGWNSIRFRRIVIFGSRQTSYHDNLNSVSRRAQQRKLLNTFQRWPDVETLLYCLGTASSIAWSESMPEVQQQLVGPPMRGVLFYWRTCLHQHLHFRLNRPPCWCKSRQCTESPRVQELNCSVGQPARNRQSRHERMELLRFDPGMEVRL